MVFDLNSFNNLQINKICRTCLTSEGDMSSVFNLNETFAVKLYDMLLACTSVRVLAFIFYT